MAEAEGQQDWLDCMRPDQETWGCQQSAIIEWWCSRRSGDSGVLVVEEMEDEGTTR